MSDLRKIIVNATSEMLDEPGENGIYRTTRFYNRLEREVTEYMQEQGVKPPIFETGTKVQGKDGTKVKEWTDDYEATVIGFRYREDGGIDYKVRCWRQNQHWWRSEDLEAIPADKLCASCRRLKDCKCRCNCGCCK